MVLKGERTELVRMTTHRQEEKKKSALRMKIGERKSRRKDEEIRLTEKIEEKGRRLARLVPGGENLRG